MNDKFDNMCKNIKTYVDMGLAGVYIRFWKFLFLTAGLIEDSNYETDYVDNPPPSAAGCQRGPI